MKPKHTHGFRKLTSVEDARRRFFRLVGVVGRVESIRVSDALDRVLARRIVAQAYLPPNDISVVDGYAVRSNDLRHASSRNPKVLRLVGESRLGELSRTSVRRGETVKVATGSIVPNGGDSVVMVEDVQALSGDRVKFHDAVPPRKGITAKGEDLRPGKLVAEKGSQLRPEEIGVLKALGLTTVPVVRRLRVGVLSTGDELVNSIRKGRSAKIVDLNRPILTAMLQQLGAVPVDLGIVKDDGVAIKAALKRGLEATDVVLVTAGSSVGPRDLVPSCINTLGKPGVIVHGVAMRPAMPTGLAVVRGKPVVSLPGFPVSAMLAFRAFVRPLLAKLVGVAELPEPTIKAVLKKRIHSIENSRTFVRVRVHRVGNRFVAVPLVAQRSSLLTSMVHANGIVTLPESVQSIEAGTEVSVTLTGSVGD